MNAPTAPMSVSQLFGHARQCLLSGRIEEAEAHCKRILKLQPRNAEALLVFALCRHGRGDFSGALKRLADALKIDPRSAALHIAYGDSLRALGKRNEAITHYSKAAAFDANQLEAHLSLGITLGEAGRHEEALARYRGILDRRPDQVDALLGASHSLLALERADEADEACRRMLQLHPDHVEAHTNRGVALQRLRRAQEALLHFDRALQLAPGHPSASYSRARLLIELGRPLEALATVDRVLQSDPKHGPSWHQKGRALARCQRLEEAIDCFRRAGELDPHEDAVRQEWANALAYAGRADEMLAVFDRSFMKRPNDAPGWTSRGHALAVLGKYDQARESYERALAIDPGNPVTLLWRGYLDLLLGDLPSGWRGYEARWDDPLSRLRRRAAAPVWDGVQPLGDKTLHVYHEQGLGDTVQFSRYLPILAERAGNIVFEVPRVLLSLLRRSLPAKVEVVEYGCSAGNTDFEIALLSLPRVCGTTLETIPAPVPAVRPDAERVAAWSQRLGPRSGLRVGVAWSGNPAHGNDAQRSIPLAHLAALARPGIQWIALQTELRDLDQAHLSSIPGLVFPGDAICDLDDTAALVELCDLVLTVDTSAAHLAGAMAKPVWIMLPSLPDWRWLLDRDDSPWYPTARLFRQQRPNDWAAVIARVAEQLAGFEP